MSERPIILFTKAIVRYWWALMSCAAFTFLGICVTVANKGRGWVLWGSFVLGIFFLFVAAYKAWEHEHHRAQEERRRYDAKFKGLPRLQVREISSGSSKERADLSPGVYNLDDPSSYPKCTTIYTLSLTFENDPLACTSDSVAKGVSARITVYDSTTGLNQLSVDGRWSTVVERKGRKVLGSEVLIDEIPISGRRELIVAIKDAEDGVCYGTSVDAFHEAALVFGKTGPASRLVVKGEDIDVLIRVRGVNVDQCWLMQFTNEELKPFGSVECNEVKPSYDYASERRRRRQ